MPLCFSMSSGIVVYSISSIGTRWGSNGPWAAGAHCGIPSRACPAALSDALGAVVNTSEFAELPVLLNAVLEPCVVAFPLLQVEEMYRN